LLVHGGKDELVSPLQSSRLAEVLSQASVRHLHVEIPWGNHAMEANLAGPSGQITMYLVERFVRTVTG
jgi:acetyl esterase/lipase